LNARRVARLGGKPCAFKFLRTGIHDDRGELRDDRMAEGAKISSLGAVTDAVVSGPCARLSAFTQFAYRLST